MKAGNELQGLMLERPLAPGPQKGSCPCDDDRCPKYGTLRLKVWSDGSRHIKLCPCRRCSGGRTKARARAREHKVATAVGGRRNPGSGAFGGVDTIEGRVLVEETANVSLIRGLRRWWESAQIRNKVATLYSTSLLPRAFVASWSEGGKTKPRLAVMTFEDLKILCSEISPHEIKGYTQVIRRALDELERKVG